MLWTTYAHNLRAARHVAASAVHDIAQTSLDPTWRFVKALKRLPTTTPSATPFSKACQACGVSSQEWRRLRPILAQSDIQSAMKALKENGVARIPPWLLLYLVSYKVRSPDDATGFLLPTVFQYIPGVSTSLQCGLLVITTLHLARFSMLAQLQQTVKVFLATPHPPSETAAHFNHLIVALSNFPVPSGPMHKLIVDVLLVMESRRITLWSSVYHRLLKNRFITIELTKYLRERMIREGFVPEAEHLEAYLKVFARGGLIEDAQNYYAALSSHPNASQDVQSKAKQSMIAAHIDPASAFDFLRKISQPTSPVFSAGPKRHFTIREWTAAFGRLARDRTNNATHLTRSFRVSEYSLSTANRPAFRPTVVTHTLFIRALLRRGRYEAAERAFYTLRHSGIRLNATALSAGINAITLAGRPHTAFVLLEQYCSRRDAPAPAQGKIFHPVTINIMQMNQFLLNLLKTGRPDIVFLLWDRLPVLYGLPQDERTLSILIQAVRNAVALDDTLLARLRGWRQRKHLAVPDHGDTSAFPYGSVPIPGLQIPSRRRILKGIHEVLINRNPSPTRPKLREYKSGVWCKQLPARRMKLIFCVILLRYRPDLIDVNMPVQPLQHQVDEFHWFAVLPRLDDRRPIKWFLPEDADIRKVEGWMPFPGIVPSDRNFFQFMVLLALSPPCGPSQNALGDERSFAEMTTSEIPLLLAWMRKLDITPSTETIALALELWREATAQAPLIEQQLPQTHYERLLRWLTDWLGEASMPQPHQHLVSRTRRLLMAERSRQGWPFNLARKNRRWFSSKIGGHDFKKLTLKRDTTGLKLRRGLG